VRNPGRNCPATEVKITMNDKQSCEDSLYGSLTRTAVWRRRLLAKYPQDTRNGRAAETLEKIAGETNDLTDAQWEKLSKSYNWSSGIWADAVSLASRHVEFQRNVRTFPSFVDNLISILAEESQQAVVN
jgi:hypothetical protein